MEFSLRYHSLLPIACKLLFVIAVVNLTGCSLQTSHSAELSATTVTGRVHGGQQPVANSIIRLYAVGATGNGSSATSLLSRNITTDANGSFSITGAYSCSNATLVYLTATEGNSGSLANNPNLALMAIL